MRAIILSAGFGTRLKPLSDTTPKPLVLVNNRPMLSYSLDLLQHYNVNEVMINAHYLGEQIKDYIEKENNTRFRIKLYFQDERKKILGSAGAIAKAHAWLYEKDSSALVWNADSLFTPNISDFMKYHERSVREGAFLSMILAPYPKTSPNYMQVQVRGEKVFSFASSEKEKAFYFLGGYILHEKGARLIPGGEKESAIQETVWKPLAKEGKVFYWNYEGAWEDMGYLAGLQRAEKRIQNGDFSFR